MKWIVVLLTLLCLYQWKKMQTKAAGCPKGFTPFAINRCFYVSPQSVTYENAKQLCAKVNSQLVPPITCDAQMVLNAFLVQVRRPYPIRWCNKPDCEGFWIGIENLTGGTWTTSRGINITQSGQCQHWAEHYPRGDGRCVVMSFQEYRLRGKWQNENCEKKLRFVCMSCPNNFEYIPEINECLLIYNKLSNWGVAQSTCPKLKTGAELLTIKSSKKQKAVARFLQTKSSNETEMCKLSAFPSGRKIFWMGGQTENPIKCNTPFVWKPAGKAPSKPLTYTNWIAGIPNCGYQGENCIIMAGPGPNQYRWEDFRCDFSLCCVCEF